MSSIIDLTALEQAELLRKREISSTELCRIYLDRITEHNDSLSAFVRINARRALLNAKRCDFLLRKKSKETPVFCGVPTGIKDLVQTKFIPTNLGSQSYKYFVPFADGTIVTRMKQGGMVSLGKLATSEFGILPITEPDIHPPTRNPWNLEHSAGGSSGGSAAAVAANLIPIAQGSDGGGSIRIPSSFCHLYGFKPSLSLIGNMHGKFNAFGMSVMGPIAKSVEDAATMLDVMTGNHSLHNRPCWQATQRAPSSLRIHLILNTPVIELHPEVIELTKATAKTLEELGHKVELIQLEEGSIKEFLPIWQYLIAQLPIYFKSYVQPVTRWLFEEGQQYGLEECLALQKRFCQRITTAFGEADMLLTPTVPHPAPKINQFYDRDPRKMFTNAAPVGPFTVLFNLSQGPAASLPLGLTSTGLPIGIQIGSHPGRDQDVLTLSRQLEQALPWKDRLNTLQQS